MVCVWMPNFKNELDTGVVPVLETPFGVFSSSSPVSGIWEYSRFINPSDFFIPHDCASHFVSPRVDDRFADPALQMASQATSPDPQAPTGPPTYKSDQIL